MATDVIKTKYYTILTNKAGRRVLITHKKILADAICFCVERKVYAFNDPDGKRVFSIDCDERVQRIAEQLCLWHSEALLLNKEA